MFKLQRKLAVLIRGLSIFFAKLTDYSECTAWLLVAYLDLQYV